MTEIAQQERVRERRKRRRGISPGKRYRILQRDGFKCVYCGAKAGDVELQIDHVVPVARGGGGADDNLVASCSDCNSGKSDHVIEVMSVGLAQTKRTPVRSHPLVGLYCLETCKDPGFARFGWNWSRQAKVDSVCDGVALLQIFSCLSGEVCHIEPMPIAQLLSGDWKFYKTHERWLEVGQEAQERYWRCARAEMDAQRAASTLAAV